ncbi:Para-nitrobenzyl esterase [Pseudovibrio axinellae]|uniref:Carboxylic ester hydrolase n=1 Tax=Pseudovibrio axinellae TaxID=989403 RepID=A0A161UZS3_9HYPH|nr:carboxylesterase family protein [Pseudovibrio axinellae]KZL06750.1 Para-nitrobenzyl esterase [Pseudovibrio axinellae]SER62894.1 para-nitrobenzyl esterase [Pseudovibrio axinellae]
MKIIRLASAALLYVGLSIAATSSQSSDPCGGQDPCAVLANKDIIYGLTQSINGNQYNVFKGIEYASKPDRWSYSEIVTSYTGEKSQAKEFKDVCPQLSSDGKYLGKEDCLYLNIWTPYMKDYPDNNLPVMVFIHGGAFVVGASSSKYPSNPNDPANRDTLLYDGATFATEQNVILVTINYRLGALGFLNLDKGEITSDTSKSNYGVRDQLVALQWVQDNIASFGGDKNNVTLFGESAGAMSTGLHLLSIPESQDKFQAAIMQSNPIGFKYRNAKEGEDQAGIFLDCLNKVMDGEKCNLLNHKALDTNEVKLLETPTLDQILEAQRRYANYIGKFAVISAGLPGALPFTPIIDGTFVTQQPTNQLQAGSPKPLIFGFNKDEGVYFSSAIDKTQAFMGYKALVTRLFDSSSEILSTDRYRQDISAANGLQTGTLTALSNLINDFAFSCKNMAADQKNVTEQSRIWAYYFTQTDAILDLPPSDKDPNKVCFPDNQWDNSCHAAELPFVFNSLPASSDEQLKKLANTMNESWANFAKNHDPTSKDRKWLVWEKADANNAQLNILPSTSDTSDDKLFGTRNCQNWISDWTVKITGYDEAQEVLTETLK